MILRLTRMELKKIGWKKTLLVFIALSLPWLYIYTVSLQDVHRINWQELSYIKTVQGPLTEEKYQMISDDLKNLGYDSSAELRETTEEEMEQLSQRGKYGDTIGNDKYFMENALNTCNYILNQEHLRLTIMEQARQNLKTLPEDASYEIRMNRDALQRASTMAPLEIMKTNNCFSNFYSNLSQQQSVTILLAVIILLAGIAAREHETKMMPLLLSSRNGKGSLFTAKALACALVGIAVTVYFNLLVFCCMVYTYGIDGILNPLNNLPEFQLSLSRLNLLQFFFIQLLMQCIATVVFSFIVLLLSALTRGTIVSAAISGVLAAGVVWAEHFLRITMLAFAGDAARRLFFGIKQFLFAALYYPGGYFTMYQTVDVLGFPVPLPWFTACMSLLTGAVLLFFARLAYLHKSGGRKRRKEKAAA